tara:strand:- start:543 stop:701 length:159 start_codon:yes stop_codon:yes gene_type:complete
MTFERWYKDKNPELDPTKDDFCGELKEAYEAGWDACADLQDCFTYDEVMEHD